MMRAFRPKPLHAVTLCAGPTLRWTLALGGALLPVSGWAQVASTYATRDGRVAANVLTCVTTDGSYTAQPCGVGGYPLHVLVDNTAGGASAPGAAASTLQGVQGGGPAALPVAVAQSGLWTLALPGGSHLALDAGGNVIGAVTQGGTWTVAVNNLPATQAVSAAALPLPAGAATAARQATINADGGAQVHLMNPVATQPVSGSVTVSGAVTVGNLPATQPVSAAALPLPAGAATAANQAAVNGDGGSQVHVMNLPATQVVSGSVSVANLPATQAVSAAALPLPAGAATAANQAAVNTDGGSQVHLVNALPAGANSIGTVVEANRSGAWTDASLTATATASVPSALGAVASRTGLHVWNVGTAVACLNYTSAAATAGSGCAAGSVPIPAGSAYLEDQPGNVSPEAISLVCAGASCPLTIKVR